MCKCIHENWHLVALLCYYVTSHLKDHLVSIVSSGQYYCIPGCVIMSNRFLKYDLIELFKLSGINFML